MGARQLDAFDGEELSGKPGPWPSVRPNWVQRRLVARPEQSAFVFEMEGKEAPAPSDALESRDIARASGRGPRREG